MTTLVTLIFATMFRNVLGFFLTIPQMTAIAVAPFADKVLTTREIRAVVKTVYPQINDGSILPSDMSAHTYSALRVFEKVGTSRYRVLPAGEQTHKQTARSTQAGLTDAEVVEALQRRIALDGKRGQFKGHVEVSADAASAPAVEVSADAASAPTTPTE